MAKESSKKKRSELSPHDAPRAKSAKPIRSGKIDYSDIPRSTTAELKRARRVGRPRADKVKRLIAIRIDPDLLNQLRILAAKRKKPYQRLLHEMLESAVRRAA